MVQNKMTHRLFHIFTSLSLSASLLSGCAENQDIPLPDHYSGKVELECHLHKTNSAAGDTWSQLPINLSLHFQSGTLYDWNLAQDSVVLNPVAAYCKHVNRQACAPKPFEFGLQIFRVPTGVLGTNKYANGFLTEDAHILLLSNTSGVVTEDSFYQCRIMKLSL
jgi:hypothetical protein